MSKSTPGPWKVYGGAYRFIVACEQHPRKLICDAPDSEPNTDEERANVNLIAAAPDLLEALKGLSRGGCFCQVAIGNPMYREHTAVCNQAVRALAKAEGR